MQFTTVREARRNAIEYGDNSPIPFDATMRRNLVMALVISVPASWFLFLVGPSALMNMVPEVNEIIDIPFFIVGGILYMMGLLYVPLLVGNILSAIINIGIAIISGGWQHPVSWIWHWLGVLALLPPIVFGGLLLLILLVGLISLVLYIVLGIAMAILAPIFILGGLMGALSSN